jgi:hypothetical protein
MMPLLRRAGPGHSVSLHPFNRAKLRWGSAACLVALGACGGTEPRIPTALTLSATAISLTSLGQTQQLSPTVTDQTGDALPDAAVSWSSSNAAVAQVSPTGVVTAISNGSAQVTATAGAATASATVTVAQAPAELVKIAGDEQNGIAGQTLALPLVVQVNDALGNPVANATVVFTTSQGVGSVTPTTTATTAQGQASTLFRLGTAIGLPQHPIAAVAGTTISASFSATATAPSGSYDITLRFVNMVTPSQQQAFTDARLQWESLIVGELEDGLLQLDADEVAFCNSSLPAVNEQVDDVLIYVIVEPIDGPEAVLAQAGPCFIRNTDLLTVHGVMRFDSDDLELIETEGLLARVILHEMGHVLGFGTLWIGGLLADPSLPDPLGKDPHFTGAQAIVAFDAIGGSSYTAGKVPVQNTGGAGNADAHWRDSVFGRELMTGFINAGVNPLSSVSVASLGDLGYIVNPSAAESYTLSPSFRELLVAPELHLKNDILRRPIRMLDRGGRVTGELRR